MSDVARLAGVHPSTVSRALRNDHRLPVETRERLNRLAEELGYRPNPLVSALIAGRKKRHRSRSAVRDASSEQPGSVLAFLTMWEKRGQWRRARQYAEVFEAMKRGAWKRGYGLEEFWLREKGMTAGRLERILLARGIRGIVVCPLPGGLHELEFDFSRFSSVALGYTLHEPRLDHVAYDYPMVLKIAVQHLRQRGFSRLGFVTTSHTSNRVAHLSLGAFLAERHLDQRRFMSPLVLGSGLAEETETRVETWIREKCPDVVITPTQAECVAVREIAKRMGISIPGDLSLICLDCHVDTKDGGMMRDTEAEARAVIELLTSRVERGQEGIPATPQTILIGGHWKEEPKSVSKVITEKQGDRGSGR